MINPEFKQCSCGRFPNVSQIKDRWYLECGCGKCIIGCKSKEQLLRGWDSIIKRYSEESKNEKAKKRPNLR